MNASESENEESSESPDNKPKNAVDENAEIIRQKAIDAVVEKAKQKKENETESAQ